MDDAAPTITMKLILAFFLLVISHRAIAQPSDKWGDQRNGTYANPVIPGDYSDLDAIRVEDDYYAISSTFQFSPGMVILHSRDLVNWRLAGHVITDLTQISPALNWDKMDRYGKGVWAGSIRYHQGKFWVYFCTPDEGFFMSTATNPAGPWEPLHKLWEVAGWDDCCPFWDDNGQGYLVATNFADTYKIHLFRLSSDGRQLRMESDSVIHQSKGSEANKLYKINGLYYHFYSEVKPEGRVTMMHRAKSIYGPYETKQLNHVKKKVDKEPNQGGLIQVPSGNWWFFTHQGTGDWEGRAACLLPVTWVEGWPIIGRVGSDTIGNMVWSAKKPVAGKPVVIPQANDEFGESTLPVQWEWNYQPRSDKWSLTERPGFLRLRAFRPVEAQNEQDKRSVFHRAGNTLTQRSMRTQRSEVTVKLDISGMADGQWAGLGHFSKSFSLFGIRQQAGVRRLICDTNGQPTEGPTLSGPVIWLRSNWGYDGLSRYAYSLDGKTFVPFGMPYQLSWGYYRGDRIALYSYNPLGEAGHVDVDSFQYNYAAAPAK